MRRGSGVSLWKLDPPELRGNGVPTSEWRGSIQLLILGGCRFPLAGASGPSPLVFGSPCVSGWGHLPSGCGGDVSVSRAPVGAGCELAGREDTGGGRVASRLPPPAVPGGAGRLHCRHKPSVWSLAGGGCRRRWGKQSVPGSLGLRTSNTGWGEGAERGPRGASREGRGRKGTPAPWPRTQVCGAPPDGLNSPVTVTLEASASGSRNAGVGAPGPCGGFRSVFPWGFRWHSTGDSCWVLVLGRIYRAPLWGGDSEFRPSAAQSCGRTREQAWAPAGDAQSVTAWLGPHPAQGWGHLCPCQEPLNLRTCKQAAPTALQREVEEGSQGFPLREEPLVSACVLSEWLGGDMGRNSPLVTVAT